MSHIAPSILAADFTRLGEEVERARKAGAKYLHLDVMDGHFVPNLTFGSELVHQLRPHCGDMIFDVHLMMTDPLAFIPEFAAAGADMITVHAECNSDIGECVELIRSLGKRPGISIKPATPSSAVYDWLDRIGLVLVMTVEPGFGAQHMLSHCLDKLSEIRAEANRRGCGDILLSVDGGVKPDNCAMVAQRGADILVAGSAIFGADDLEAALRSMENSVSGK